MNAVEKWNELQELLQSIRTALDAADGTPFGKIGPLLDTMANDTDRAISTAKALREAHQ